MEDIKYFAVLYLHWYHKDHHGAVEGVYATKAAAINHINLRKKQSKFAHVNHDKTLLAVNDVKPTNYSQLQYDIFIVLPIHVKKESGKVTLKINVLFPTEVSCAEGENEKYDYAEKLHDRIKQHINIVVLDKHTDKTKLTFSTEDNNLKVVDFVCDCLVKQ